MAPCRFFAKGACTYGVLCKNSHEATVEGQKTSMERPRGAAMPAKKLNNLEGLQSSSKSSAEVCWFFTQGTCTYGSSCRKSHDIPHPTSLPHPGLPTDVAAASQIETSPNMKSCTAYRLPTRPLKADVQPFSPGPSAKELVQDSAITLSHSTTCIFFARGFCRNGSDCVFGHGIQVADLAMGKSPVEEGVASASVS